jgi:hypothetical protein
MPFVVAGFDIDNAEFVVEKFFVVVGVENLNLGDGRG